VCPGSMRHSKSMVSRLHALHYMLPDPRTFYTTNDVTSDLGYFFKLKVASARAVERRRFTKNEQESRTGA